MTSNNLAVDDVSSTSDRSRKNSTAGQSRKNSTPFKPTSELEVVKGQLEEQIRLTAFYKNRGDEFNRKNMALEKLNKDMVEQKAFKFLKVDKGEALKEEEMVEQSMKKITEQENTMMKSRLD